MLIRKKQIFAGTDIITLVGNLIGVIAIEALVVEGWIRIFGNPIYCVGHSVSPLLAFFLPFAILATPYGMYCWNENSGLGFVGM